MEHQLLCCRKWDFVLPMTSTGVRGKETGKGGGASKWETGKEERREGSDTHPLHIKPTALRTLLYVDDLHLKRLYEVINLNQCTKTKLKVKNERRKRVYHWSAAR